MGPGAPSMPQQRPRESTTQSPLRGLQQNLFLTVYLCPSFCACSGPTRHNLTHSKQAEVTLESVHSNTGTNNPLHPLPKLA